MRKKFIPLASLVLCCLWNLIGAQKLSARIFTNQDGKTIDAELYSFDGTTVRFKSNRDTRIYEVPFESLSLKDQAFIENEQKIGRLTQYSYTGLYLPEVAEVEKNARHFNASRKIDQLLENYWSKNEVEPSAIVDDEIFVRRAYLKVIGRIPTHAEAVHFLNSKSPTKRAELIDDLLDSNGYVSHNFNLWADVLRVRTIGREGTRFGGIYYAQWLKDRIRENTSYDQMVQALITAEGYPWDNPAAAYYLRDFGMPLDNMSMTAQIFLGTQLQCAQCHNHPTDKWTQKEFYELSAFTYGIQTRININHKSSEYADTMRQLRELARENNDGERLNVRNNIMLRAAREFMQPMNWGVTHTNRKLHLPADYQYDDASPKSKVEPAVIYGELGETELHDPYSTVSSYADWLVSENNDRFTRVIANRMWKHAMGLGLIEPVDNLTDETEAVVPDLMAFLETLMKAVDYDLKQYLRVLYNTQYFQRAAVIDNPDLDDDYFMEGPILQRMTSEQIWDSIATLMTPDVDNILQQSYKGTLQGVTYETGKKPAVAVMLDEKEPEAFLAYIEKLTDKYKVYSEIRAKAAEYRNDATLRNTPKAREVQREFRRINNEWRAMINPDGDIEEDEPQLGITMMMSNTDILQKGKKNKKQQSQEVKWMAGIRRASELQSPQANGHLLEVFGQSDRMLIENSENGSNVLQALFLMNSWQINGILAHSSAPVVEARIAKTIEDKIETLYIGFLSRKPTAEETAALTEYYRKEPMKARERIIWAMMNSQQFIFVQ
ncbi:MAG: DUF1549 domain-containing protein [Lentimonas sp.]